MGNGTCMVSKLPILFQTKVKLFFLHDSWLGIPGINYLPNPLLNNNGVIYSTGLLSPAFLPLNCEYDDYGLVRNIEKDTNYYFIENHLRKKFNKIKHGNEEINNPTLYDFIHTIRDGDEYNKKESCVYWNQKENDWLHLNLSYTLIREDVYDKCCSLIDKEKYFWSRTDELYPDFLERTYKESIEFFKEKKEFYFGENKKEHTVEEIVEFTVRENDLTRIFYLNLENTKTFMASFDYELYLLHNSSDQKIVDDIYKLWSSFQKLQHFLDECRLFWCVQTVGGEDQRWDLIKSLNEEIIKICDKNLDEFED